MNEEDEILKMIEFEIDDGIKSLEKENEDILEEHLELEESDELIIQNEAETTGKKKNKKIEFIVYEVIRYAVMLIALVVFGYAAYELTLIYVDSREGEDIKNEASNMFLVNIDDLQEDYVPSTNNGETINLNNSNDGKVFVFDYEKMLEYNSESKGYIRQDNGEYIDNPILQHEDNEYYLTHLANHKKSSLGAIFIDCNIEEGLEARNCIIYGHNMGQRVDHIMFGSLNWYYYQTGYYKAHPTFDIWIENQRYRYYVFAVYKTEAAGSPVYTYSFESDEAFLQYLEECKFKSRYEFKGVPKFSPESKIITLSTCTSADEYRMIVQLIRGEKLDAYGNVME